MAEEQNRTNHDVDHNGFKAYNADKSAYFMTDFCDPLCQVHAGEEDHARPGWTTSRRGQDSLWKSDTGQ